MTQRNRSDARYGWTSVRIRSLQSSLGVVPVEGAAERSVEVLNRFEADCLGVAGRLKYWMSAYQEATQQMDELALKSRDGFEVVTDVIKEYELNKGPHRFDVIF